MSGAGLVGKGASPKVLIADALSLFAEALGVAIGLEPDIFVFPEHPVNGPVALEAVVRLKPDVALIDFWMPDMDGPTLAAAIDARVPKCKVILLSWMFGAAQIQQALSNGAWGLLPKDVRLAQVASAIRQAHRGEISNVPNQLVGQIEERIREGEVDLFRFYTLTPREIEILTLLNFGQTISVIAKRLVVSPKTVRNHISQLLAKTNCQSQIEVVAKARGCGFLKI